MLIGVVGSSPTLGTNYCSYNLMVECLFGMEAMKVRFFLRAPVYSGLSIMDNTAVFYTVNMGSIPVGRANKYTAGFGEMDIIAVFETVGGSSILSSPAR